MLIHVLLRSRPILFCFYSVLYCTALVKFYCFYSIIFVFRSILLVFNFCCILFIFVSVLLLGSTQIDSIPFKLFFLSCFRSIPLLFCYVSNMFYCIHFLYYVQLRFLIILLLLYSLLFLFNSTVSVQLYSFSFLLYSVE